MNKSKIITISVITAVLALLLGGYLFALPALINLNAYKGLITKSIKDQTGLNLSIDNVGFKTNLNLSVDVFADKINLTYTDGKPLLVMDRGSLNLPLLPLAFKNIEINAVKVINPQISLSRDKSGIYSYEYILKNIKPSEQKQDFKLVNGIDVEIKNYKLNLDDYGFAAPQKFILEGDLIKISDFNPDKFIKLETKGKLLVQEKPAINFDVKFRSELPFASSTENKKSKNADINPFAGIIKYNFKTDIAADLELQNVQKDLNINGFINFDNLSLKIKDKMLPSSYGKLKFSGKSFDIDSKLFITPESYISATGNIKDIKNNKMDLSIKTSDINFKDILKFTDVISDVVSVDIDSLKDIDINGKLKADFKIADNSSYSGYLNVSNTNIIYNGISKPIQNINSTINFEGNKFIITDTYGFLDNNRFDISGFVDSNNLADLKLNLNSFNIKTIKDLANQSNALKSIKPQLKDITSLSGTIKVETAIKGKLNEKLSPEIKIVAINPSVIHRQIGFPISLSKGQIIIKGSTVDIKDLQADALQSSAFISGHVYDFESKTPKPEISVNIPALNISKIKLLANSPILDKNSKTTLKNIQNLSGTVSANAKISQDNTASYNAMIKNITAYYAPSALPLTIKSGVLSSDGKILKISNLSLKASNSPVNISGTVESLAKLPVVDLKASGYIAASDIKKYSSPELRKSISAKGNVPINAGIAGYVDGWKLNSQMNIDNISYFAKINNPGSKIVKFNIKGTPSSLTLSDSGLYTSAGSKLVSVTGAINSYSSKNPVLNNLQLALTNLDLSLVEPKGKLQLNGIVSLSGSAVKPKTAGNITVKNISVPSMYFSTDNIALVLKNNDILVNTGILNVIDSKFKINMTVENNFSSPVVIVKNINVTSDYMNADKLQKAFPPVPYQDTPVIVKKGNFTAAKMVMNSLPITNTSVDFVINPMNIFKASNLVAAAAGGTATGNIYMNLKNSKVSADINTKNMEINSLASAFANLPNEIYGAMDGNIDIATYGYTPEQTANNAQGSVVFTVTNGKLIKLGSISNLLKAPNILSGGIGPQIIDNIAAFKEAKNSNQFKKLVGNITINNGIMNINELSSQGGDMSMLIKGSLGISNNLADITVLGTLADRIASKLGRIPLFSAEKLINDKIINKIPGQWGQVISKVKPKPQYPDIDKIPQLSRGNSETDRHFAVKIQGNFYKPSSIKSFKLID